MSLEKTLCQEWNLLFALCELETRKDDAERLGRALQVNFEWRASITFLLRCTALQAGAYYPTPTAMKNILNCKCQLKNPSVLYTLHPVQIRDEVWLHFVSVFPLSSCRTCAFLKNWVKSWGNNILLPLLSFVGIPTALNTVNSDPTEKNSTLALRTFKWEKGKKKKAHCQWWCLCFLSAHKSQRYSNMLHVYGLTHKICFHFSYSLIIHKILRST